MASSKKARSKSSPTQLAEEHAALKLKYDKLFNEWVADRQKSGEHMAAALERQKLQKILKIVGFITSGKSNEAIQELLEPMPVVIGLDIRFADDATRKAAEKETYYRGVNDAIAALTRMVPGSTEANTTTHKENQ